MTKSKLLTTLRIKQGGMPTLAFLAILLLTCGYPVMSKETPPQLSEKMKSTAKDSKLLKELKEDSFERPQFVVFLRHFG